MPATDKERVRICPIRYPMHKGVSQLWPHQAEFHNACNADGSKPHVKLAVWGMGAGKSQCCAVEFVKHVMMHPGKWSAVIAQTGPVLERNVLPKFEQLDQTFRQFYGIPLILQYEKTRKIYHWINGHMTWLIPSDDPRKLQGVELTHAMLEEAGIIRNQEHIFTELMQRMRVCDDWMIFGATTFYPDSWIISHVKKQVQLGNPDFWMSRHPSSSNPIVTKAHIEALRKSMSDPTFRAAVMADDTVEFLTTVYGGAFSVEHSRTPVQPTLWTGKEPGIDYTMFAGVDWGEVRAHMVTVVRDLKTEFDYVIDDFPIDRAGFDNQVREVTGRMAWVSQNYHLKYNAVYTDPTGQEWNALLRRQLAGKRIMVAFTLDKEARRISWGLEQVRQRLLAADGVRRLFFCPCLLALPWNQEGGRGIWQALQKYHWAMTRDGEVMGKAHDDEKYVHACDALRYPYINMNRGYVRVRAY